MINSIIRLFTTIAPDFEVLWLGARDLLLSNNPYLNTQIFTGIGYPPNSLLFYLPLTNLNYMLAQNIFTIISVISLFLSIYLILKILKINKFYLLPTFLLALFTFPTKFTLGMGQNNFIALVLLLFSFYLYKSKKIIYAGIVLGLAITLKTIFVYFMIFYLVKKQWKVLFYSGIVIFMSIMTIYIIRGNFDLFTFYYQHILPPLFRFEDREIYLNQGISGIVSRTFNDIGLRKNITLISAIGLIISNVAAIYREKNINLVFSLTTITLLLVDSLAWQHHFVWLFFPILFLFIRSKKLVIKLLIFLAFILVSLNIPTSYLLQDHVFLGTIILYAINIKYIYE